MDKTKLTNKINSIQEELKEFEEPFLELVNKYSKLRENENTIDSEITQNCYKEILLFQAKIRGLQDRLQSLEGLLGTEPVPLNSEYIKEDAEMLRDAFEAPLYDENNSHKF